MKKLAVVPALLVAGEMMFAADAAAATADTKAVAPATTAVATDTKAAPAAKDKVKVSFVAAGKILDATSIEVLK